MAMSCRDNVELLLDFRLFAKPRRFISTPADDDRSLALAAAAPSPVTTTSLLVPPNAAFHNTPHRLGSASAAAAEPAAPSASPGVRKIPLPPTTDTGGVEVCDDGVVWFAPAPPARRTRKLCFRRNGIRSRRSFKFCSTRADGDDDLTPPRSSLGTRPAPSASEPEGVSVSISSSAAEDQRCVGETTGLASESELVLEELPKEN
mmetsp:Transcript_4798/g.11807  ORF Transcript_4798/g.11807 Transcript_4798/m.11807 type:complete len:204 (-) Transcript_4798:53-664(-)